MSQRVGTPINQVKLSNVAVVKYQKDKKTFEVAAYPSKVVDFRNGIEVELDEVLQVVTVFRNVSKGVIAPMKEVKDVFGDAHTACRVILMQGSLQVSEKERSSKSEALFKEIAGIVADKTLEIRTGRAFAPSTIERAMHEIQYIASRTKVAKVQALEVIKRLESTDMGLKRAPMRLRVTHDDAFALDALKGALAAVDGVLASSIVAADNGVTLLVETRSYRDVVATVAAGTESKGVVERLVVSRRRRPSASPGASPPYAHRRCKVVEHAARDHVGKQLGELGGAAPPRASFFGESGPVDGPVTSPASRVPTQPKPRAAAESAPAKRLSCTTCGGDFSGAAQHREHFRSDWHRHNLNLKIQDPPLPPIPQAEFEALGCLEA